MEDHIRKLQMGLKVDNRPDAPLVQVQELYRFFHDGDEETVALRGVSFEVKAGELVAVVGPSGSGKSTLLNCIAGLDEPDGGHVAIAGQRITRRPEGARAKMRCTWMGVFMQSGNLIEHLSVEQNIRMVQHLASGEHPNTYTLLASVGLGERASAWPPTLSGGEAARAGLAVALANDPPVLLADEPTGEVDTANEETILRLLMEMTERGGAVIVVTHSERVAGAADSVIRLSDGRIVNG
jgi:putative ABC transport system ATP-binding protein